MASAIKKTTGLTGLAVSKHPDKVLSILHNKIMRCLQKMPEDAAYRQYTEQIVSEREAALKTRTSVEDFEIKLNSGQIEELIAQADAELQLARKMLEWKAWEPLVQEPHKNQWKWPI